MTVAAILKHKGHEVVSLPPHATLADLAGILARRRIGAAVVQEADHHLLGIVSERDVVGAIAAHGAAALAMRIEALMTRNVATVTPRTSVAEAMAVMTDRRFRHLPVMDGGELVGLVSIGDVVKARITTQEGEVESLKAYVAGAA